jgi:hypothetical protein
VETVVRTQENTGCAGSAASCLTIIASITKGELQRYRIECDILTAYDVNFPSILRKFVVFKASCRKAR